MSGKGTYMCSHRTLAVIAFCVLVVAVPVAWAHKPIFPDGRGCDQADAIAVEDVSVSQVAYTELTETCPQLWLTFEGVAGQDLYLQIALPQIERFKDLRPAVAVLGPGLPTVSVPFAVPSGYGGYVFKTDDVSEPKAFHEPFTGTDSWILKELNQTVPAAGTYYIVAYIPSGQFGKIWVAFGKAEQFGLGDLLNFGNIVATVRAFHEVSRGGGICPVIGFLPIVLGAALLPLWVRPRSRRRLCQTV
jgi:hypothetical protein